MPLARGALDAILAGMILLGGWVARHQNLVRAVDQGAILLVVYTAFSAATGEGLWRRLQPQASARLLLATTMLCSRLLGFNREDEVAIIFCASKKSRPSGVPIVKVVFAGHALGSMILPLI